MHDEINFITDTRLVEGIQTRSYVQQIFGDGIWFFRLNHRFNLHRFWNARAKKEEVSNRDFIRTVLKSNVRKNDWIENDITATCDPFDKVGRENLKYYRVQNNKSRWFLLSLQKWNNYFSSRFLYVLEKERSGWSPDKTRTISKFGRFVLPDTRVKSRGDTDGSTR